MTIVALHSCQACRRHPDTHVAAGDDRCPMCGLGREKGPEALYIADNDRSDCFTAHEFYQANDGDTLPEEVTSLDVGGSAMVNYGAGGTVLFTRIA